MEREVYKKYWWAFAFLGFVSIFLISFLFSVDVVRLAPEGDEYIANHGGPYYGNVDWVVELDASGSSPLEDIVSFTWQYTEDGDIWVDITGCVEIADPICSFDTAGVSYDIQIKLTLKFIGGSEMYTYTILYDYCDVGLDESFTLPNNLDCTGKSFSLSGDSLVFDCGDYSVTGDVSVEGDSDEVSGCDVTGDVFVSGGSCLLEDSSFNSLTFEDADECVAEDVDVTGDVTLDGTLEDYSVDLISSSFLDAVVNFGFLNVKYYVDVSALDLEGNYLEGVSVEIEDQDGVLVVDAETDENGELLDSLVSYTLSKDEQVDYTYVITAVYGDESYSEEFSISEDTPIELTFEVDVECLSDTDCVSGSCSGGVCVECLEDDDCASGSCSGGVCVVEDECELDSDCVSGYCYSGECVECVNSSGCAAGYSCSNNACIYGCVSNEDCTSGYCVNEECVECLYGTDCSSGVCSDEFECVECELDGDCDSGVCVDNSCEDCRVGLDCGTGYDCTNGECVVSYSSCVSDDDCSSGESCVSGVCEETSEVSDVGVDFSFGIWFILIPLFIALIILAVLYFLNIRKRQVMGLEKEEEFETNVKPVTEFKEPSNPVLVDFVKRAREKGYDEKKIKSMLIDNGWGDEEVSRVLTK